MILFENVSKRYPGTARPALSGINLTVNRAEFVFLVGASGSGKSSCLQLILREERPTAGTIHVLGQKLDSISTRKVPYFRRNLGVVFQDFRLLPNKSVFENVAFSLQVIGKSAGFIQEAIPDVLGMVGLDGKSARLPHELSGGEQQRVAIARAVVNKPALLLADEPTGNLDPTTSAGIMALLERINEGGTTVIMATHEAGIVDHMQRRVVELVGGEIVRDESRGGYGDTGAIAGLDRSKRASNAPRRAREDVPVSHATPTEAPGRARDARPTPAPVLEQSASAPREAIPDAPIPGVPDSGSIRIATHAFRSADAPPSSRDRAKRGTPNPRGGWSERLGPADAGPRMHGEIEDNPLAEQLTLAERLGLRAPGDSADQTGEQDVGPTR